MTKKLNEVNFQVVWGESLPCPDLNHRLAKIYEVAIRRAIEVNCGQSKKKTDSESASNTSTTLTQDAKATSERADD